MFRFTGFMQTPYRMGFCSARRFAGRNRFSKAAFMARNHLIAGADQGLFDPGRKFPRFGAPINQVIAESPGDKAGLRAGDGVVAIGSLTILTLPELHEKIQTRPAGQVMTLDVVREGTPVRIRVRAGERPRNQNNRVTQHYEPPNSQDQN
jgi:membrane-associated protease RseP (regulator of RpoE activity)